MNPLDLTHKKILISGALSDTGSIIAKQIVALGASVFLIDRDKPSLKKLSDALGTNSLYKSFDIFDSRAVESNLMK
jgi:NADP-dependent 3-hydroxy acid dehydrogenase YdfG